MPLYEYKCDKCHEQAELLVRGSETPKCPACGSVKLTKLLSVPAAHSHGSGGELPMCQPMPSGGCGLPQCGMGRCAGDE